MGVAFASMRECIHSLGIWQCSLHQELSRMCLPPSYLLLTPLSQSYHPTQDKQV